mmetsp:Transcript_6306/g.17078  ORF Transcript_6306/g.17078 Transcript_6306/m.17078 type:complete len:212 (-) Transcript_6306:51-686(-)
MRAVMDEVLDRAAGATPALGRCDARPCCCSCPCCRCTGEDADAAVVAAEPPGATPAYPRPGAPSCCLPARAPTPACRPASPAPRLHWAACSAASFSHAAFSAASVARSRRQHCTGWKKDASAVGAGLTSRSKPSLPSHAVPKAKARPSAATAQPCAVPMAAAMARTPKRLSPRVPGTAGWPVVRPSPALHVPHVKTRPDAVTAMLKLLSLK